VDNCRRFSRVSSGKWPQQQILLNATASSALLLSGDVAISVHLLRDDQAEQNIRPI
jgi:hypothetical protein